MSALRSRQQRSFHNRSFGEPLNDQPIADDQSMIRRLISVGPISTALTFCRTAEAPQHSMLAVMMEQEFHFSLVGSSVNPQRTGILRSQPKLKRREIISTARGYETYWSPAGGRDERYWAGHFQRAA